MFTTNDHDIWNTDGNPTAQKMDTWHHYPTTSDILIEKHVSKTGVISFGLVRMTFFMALKLS